MSLKKSPAALLSKALVFFAVALFAGSSAHAACPSYTHDGDVVLGSKKALPAGWYTYSITSQPGLYTSPLDTFLPVIIPNTSIGNAMVNADISPDGAWILFTRKASTDTGFHTYLIKKNGTGRVEVPFANKYGNFVDIAGFLRGGPRGYGLEIYYASAYPTRPGKLHAIKVDLSGATPVFGTERTLIDFRKATTGVAIISNEIGVAGDKVLAECIWNNRPGTPYRTAYITIPDSGRGTADTSNIYKWQNDDWRVLYGCGHAINATGSLCLMNGGFIGSACAPTKNVAPNGPETSQKDHKGFFITPFRRYTDAPVSYLGNDTSRGISINWCPPQWRGGNWSANSFGAWKFGNDSSYVIGNQNGTDANAQYAMWVINWKTSTWTQLTPGGAGVKTTHYNTPAVFFTAGVSSSVPREHAKAGTAAAIDMRDQGGRLNVVVNTSSPCKITGTVCNLYGRLLTRLDFDGGTRASWNHVQGATPGVYLIRVMVGESEIVRKVNMLPNANFN